MDAGRPRSARDRGYLAGLVGVLTLEGTGVAYQLATGIPVPAVTVLAAAFVVASMFRVHGMWGTMAFAALVLVIPFGSEFLGVLTGLPYGTYTYSDLLGPRVAGLVPVFIFVAWIHIGYLSIATTTLALGRSRLWLAPLDGVLAAAWDIMVDPLAVRAGFWTWAPAPGLYGVPFTNFVGWFLVVTILSLVARSVWARDARSPARVPRGAGMIFPALLLGSSLSFAALAVANGMPLAALAGLSILVPAVSLAWVHVRAAAPGPAEPSPWSRVAARPRIPVAESRLGRV